MEELQYGPGQGNNERIWQLMQKDLIDLKFMLSLLVLIDPLEFQNIYHEEIGALELFDQILIQLKQYYAKQNLEGKSLFRILVKTADGKQEGLPEEALWKVFELVFTIAYFNKSHPSFEMNLVHQDHQMFKKSDSVEVNSILTKSVIQIVSDVLK